jgi:hypothetical protein
LCNVKEIIFQGSGIRGALKLLLWLQVLPASPAAPERLLDMPAQTARLSNGEIEIHLEGVCDLERRLDYKFRDRSFLLQAITHASYSVNRVTDCYQRLEFLGDAVLGTPKLFTFNLSPFCPCHCIKLVHL